VYFAIREGVQGTPMPAWKALDENSTWDLVGYILSVAPPR
jgi:mono/diheme cytochrome c family protein